jgi:protein-tyrosine phosphatase
VSQPFVISNLMLAPLGEIAICRLPGSHSPLQDDITAICALGVACVVSLTPMEEIRRLGDAQLSAALQENNIAWHHFPILDYSTPLPNQAQDWQQLSAQLHGLLDQGQRILIHCFAGIGRSGMITMRLLVERGMSPADALALVRHVRPGAVERPAQYEWAAGQAAAL